MTESEPDVSGIEFDRRAGREQTDAQHDQLELTCKLHQGQRRGKYEVSQASLAAIFYRPIRGFACAKYELTKVIWRLNIGETDVKCS